MNEETKRLISLIESWENGYLPASAQIVFRDSKQLIISQDEQIEELKTIVDELNQLVESLRTPEPEKKENPSKSKKAGNKNEG